MNQEIMKERIMKRLSLIGRSNVKEVKNETESIGAKEMTEEQYDRIAYACENGDLSLFNRLSESDKEYFSNHFEDWESKHCVCHGGLSKK